MFYLSHTAGEKGMSKIVCMFDNNTMSKDAKVYTFASNHLKVFSKRSNVRFNRTSKKSVDN